ncbi:MAG: hypothetical protein AB200_03085 [Parcubacteria bacterium C7867-005]|nr:MAG: hypothetical protein AB200_03085 [Parcubacteria bacterium C7867-005]
MEDVDLALIDACEYFKDRGVVSAYRWGSSVRNDYRPGISDFDNLIIVDDVKRPPTETEFKEYIDRNYPQLFRFHVNYLSLDEIEGNTPHNKLIKLFPVDYLLDQFHTWKYVWGRRFSREDFKINPWNTEEIIQYHKKFALDQFKDIESKYSTGLHYLPVKSCIVLCYHLHKKIKGDHEYNYLTILNNVTDQTKDMLPLLMDLRAEQYPVEKVRVSVSAIIEWLEKKV